MKLIIISIVFVLAIASGLLLSSGTLAGFFASYSDTQAQDDAIGNGDSDSPDFGLNLKTQPRKSTTTKIQEEDTEEPDDEVPATEVNETPAVIVTGGGGGSSGGSSSSSSGGGSDEENNCVPSTCANLGYTCDSWSDGCGGTLQCGTCDAEYLCIAGTCEFQLIATISVSPPSEEVSVDDEFSIDVEIDSNSNVFSIDIELSFDETMLQVVDVTEGPFIDSRDSINNPLEPVKMSYDNDKGEVKYVHTRLSEQGGKTGSGTLITINFRAIASTNETTISVELADVIDENVDVFTVNENSGVVKINE